MSSANVGTTGHIRLPDDSYMTPRWATQAILHASRNWSTDASAVRIALDVAAAARNTGRSRPHCSSDPVLLGIEIDQGRASLARKLVPRATIVTADCFSGSWSWLPYWQSRRLRLEEHCIADRPTTVITNPPYSLAMEVILRSFEEATDPRSEFAFLLRLDWLATSGRRDFHRAHPSDVHVLPRRPSFCASLTCKEKCSWHSTQELDAPRPKVCPACGKAVRVTTSDSSEYSWFVWGPGRGNRWSILDLPTEKE